jgi:hypothetical protein
MEGNRINNQRYGDSCRVQCYASIHSQTITSDKKEYRTHRNFNKGLYMFLVPTFCEIVKHDPYILKMVKKKNP